ncbi:hypothetical protein FACS1894158_19090 [Betaproteobacteria bacterium]|nr:hypothetical protein FACS1894158_19090 [Betaproteobacteria bacterium]
MVCSLRPLLSSPEGVVAWRNTERDEQRAFHARGDGHFIIDGETINLRNKMVKWQDCI